jgi:hypothetical protein
MTSSALTERILDAFPSGSYSISALLRICDIVETDAVPTAAVECRVQPKLLINPAFVKKHAATPEKLLMLVMHELHHVLLGHTTLFPRMTPVQNFVFDAVINGIVCRMFPRPDYTAMFEDFYSNGDFPMCLLAPPPGWTQGEPRMARGIKKLPPKHRDRAHEVHQALYSDGGASYHEVYELLPKLIDQSVNAEEGKGTSVDQKLESLLRDVPLLGDHEHGDRPAGELEKQSPLLFEVTRAVVEQWPQPPDPIHGRSLANVIEGKRVVPAKQPSNRSKLRRLIRRVAGQDGAGAVRQVRTELTDMPTPIPTMARRSMILKALGQQVLLHQGPIPWRRSLPASQRVHVYLDVSGSMKSVLPALYRAILDCRDLVAPAVHLFSTSIADITLAELRAGRCRSDFGTNIRCVTEHLQKHRIRNALMVTDGFVGKPIGADHDTLAKARLGVAYLGGGICTTDLAEVTRHTTTLNQ